MTVPAWHADAACADDTVDPDWFFPAVGHDGTKAREVCADCEVREQCLTMALHQPVAGIWGGTTEPERVRMRREQGIELPQRWAAHNGRSRWEDRYYEMVSLGYSQVEIAYRWKIQPASLVRQLHRHDIPPDEALVTQAASTKYRRRAEAAS